jgi:ferredoxin
LATTAAGVYAGGDIAFGPRLIVNAVADGQRAARSIHAALQKVAPQLVRKAFFTPISPRDYPDLGPVRNYLRWRRRPPEFIPVTRRIGVATVEAGYDEETARQQASRCLVCTINPIFNGPLCILCNGCVDVCPTDCLKLVPATQVRTNGSVQTFVGRQEDGAATAAMLLDPTRCIRCGLCAARCPTGAVQMETFRFTEEIIFEAQEESV